MKTSLNELGARKTRLPSPLPKHPKSRLVSCSFPTQSRLIPPNPTKKSRVLAPTSRPLHSLVFEKSTPQPTLANQQHPMSIRPNPTYSHQKISAFSHRPNCFRLKECQPMPALAGGVCDRPPSEAQSEGGCSRNLLSANASRARSYVVDSRDCGLWTVDFELWILDLNLANQTVPAVNVSRIPSESGTP